MPRSNSSFDVAEGGKRGQRGAGAGPRAARWRCGCSGRRQGATGIARTTEIERLARTAPARRAGRRFARHRHLATAERARRARGVGILARVEGIAAAPAAGLRGCRILCDRRGRGDLRLLVVAGLGLWIALLLASPLLRIALLRIALLPLRRAGLNWRRRRGHAGLRAPAAGRLAPAARRRAGAADPRAAGCGIATPRSGRSVAGAGFPAAGSAFPGRRHRTAPGPAGRLAENAPTGT